ncbi:MAG: hypothetical protein IJ187_06300 [Neisseriaceae bacterium]|nr:hypothetical protein [Neisseriaceae bacterium]
MTDENPYAPPKSTYYMQPEQDYQPTKGQKIMRIILGTLCVPLLVGLLNGMTKTLLNSNFTLQSFLLDFIVVYVVLIVPNIIFAWVLEKYCPTIGKKIICSFIFSIIISIMIALIAIFLPAEYELFSVVMYYLIISLPATIITALILNAHYKYYKRKYFQAA